MRTFIALIAAALASCQAAAPAPTPPATPQHHADDVFGASYDECVLRNATRGGDAASRDSAEDICARHYAREAIGDELTYTVSGEITEVDGPPQNIVVRAQNDSDNLLVTSIGVTVFFHIHPKDANSHWSDGVGEPRHWTFPVHLAPHDATTRIGTFNEGDAPGHYMEYRSVYPDHVVPLGSTP